MYFAIASSELITELFDCALNKLKDSNTDDFFKDSVHDIIRLLTEYIDTGRLKKFYDMCTPCLKESFRIKEQKKAYR